MLLTPIEAAQAMCLSLVRTEGDDNVTIGVFADTKGIFRTLPFSKQDDLLAYETKFSAVIKRKT